MNLEELFDEWILTCQYDIEHNIDTTYNRPLMISFAEFVLNKQKLTKTMKHKYKHSFGDVVKDKITNFTGTITGLSSYITGCDQCLVQPKQKEGEVSYPDATWFDEGRLILIEPAQIEEKDVESESGKGSCGTAPVK